MSRPELAKKLGVTRMQVWRVENDKRGIDCNDLSRWAKALKTTAAQLLP